MDTRYGMNGDTEPYHRGMNKKLAVTTPDDWEPALPVVEVTGLSLPAGRAFRGSGQSPGLSIHYRSPSSPIT